MQVIIDKKFIDHYDHVNHNKYSILFERAQEEILKERKVSFSEIYQKFNLRCVQRVFNIEFIKALYLGDSISIHTELKTKGRTSFVFSQVIKKENIVVTKCITVYVLIGLDNNKAIMPTELKESLINK